MKLICLTALLIAATLFFLTWGAMSRCETIYANNGTTTVKVDICE